MNKQEVYKERYNNNQYKGNENTYSGKRGKLKNSKSSTVMQSDNFHRNSDRVLRESRSVSWNVPVYVSRKERQYNQGKVKKKASSYSQPSGAFGDSQQHKQAVLCEENDELTQSTEGSIFVTSKRSRSEIKKKYHNPAKKKTVSIRARYWAYLFENLKHAVDEIYVTCEGDESVVECKEVLMVLDTYQHDFQALIDWINLQEKLKKSNDQDRPTSLAWEVRKSSPGRPRQKLTPRSQKNQTTSTVAANRDIKTKPKAHTPTWADRVRGLQPESNIEKANAVADVISNANDVTNNKDEPLANGKATVHDPNFHEDIDDGGWQTVARNRPQKSQNGHDVNHNKTRSSNKINNKPRKSSKDTSPRVGNEDRKINNGTVVAIETKNKMNNAASVVAMATHNNLNGSTETKHTVNIGEVTPVAIETRNKQPTSPYNENIHTPVNNCEAPFYNYVADRITETQNMTPVELPQKPLFQDDNNDETKLKNLEELEKDFFSTDPSNQDFEIECELTESGSLKETDEGGVTSAKLREADASIAAYEQEEKDLMKEIEEEKKKTIEVDVNSTSTPLINKSEMSLNQSTASWDEIMAEFDAEQSSGQSWADLVDEELREPGRVVQMHEKLSSPSRRTHRESRQDLDQKLQLAAYRREKMLKDKAENIRNLTERVQEVRQLKNNVLTQRRIYVHEAHIVAETIDGDKTIIHSVAIRLLSAIL